MPLLRVSVFFYLFFIFISCDPSIEQVNIQSNERLTIIDSTALGIELMEFDSIHSAAFYPVYYVGEVNDTVVLGRRPVSMFYNEERDSKYDSARNWAALTGRNMRIFVDTSLNLTHKSYFSHYNDEDEEFVDSVKYHSAFPVLITNLSDSLILVGSHNIIRWMVREAKDENGRWIEIEKRITDLCGTAKRDIVIEPGHILVAKLLRYKGSYNAECRLKFKFGNEVVYSNTFNDWVDERQLL